MEFFFFLDMNFDTFGELIKYLPINLLDTMICDRMAIKQFLSSTFGFNEEKDLTFRFKQIW